MTGGIGAYVVPGMAAVGAAMILFSKKDLASSFTAGAKDGIRTALGLLPYLLLMMPAIRMFTASGITAALAKLFAPLLSAFGYSADVLPALLIRPFSGSAANALAHALHVICGVNSRDALLIGVFYGTCDTVFYILPCYFAAAGVRKGRYAVGVAIIVTFAAVFYAAAFSSLLL